MSNYKVPLFASFASPLGLRSDNGRGDAQFSRKISRAEKEIRTTLGVEGGRGRGWGSGE